MINFILASALSTGASCIVTKIMSNRVPPMQVPTARTLISSNVAGNIISRPDNVVRFLASVYDGVGQVAHNNAGRDAVRRISNDALENVASSNVVSEAAPQAIENLRDSVVSLLQTHSTNQRNTLIGFTIIPAIAFFGYKWFKQTPGSEFIKESAKIIDIMPNEETIARIVKEQLEIQKSNLNPVLISLTATQVTVGIASLSGVFAFAYIIYKLNRNPKENQKQFKRTLTEQN